MEASVPSTDTDQPQRIAGREQSLFRSEQTISVHNLFEAQVAQTPDRIAVVFGDEALTYRVLNERANQLAHYLQHLGVQPETRVGIFLNRSLEAVIGILGILKAGGAFLSFDPTYPSEYLDFLFSDAQVSLLLTQKHLLPFLPERYPSRQVFCLDSEQPLSESRENPIGAIHRDNLAYIIYTSGSTGKPKGVMISHSALRNHLLWRQNTYPLTETDHFLHKASLSFDIAVWEILAPLLAGACLVIAHPDGSRDCAYLVQLIIEQNVTILHFGPPMLQLFLEEPESSACHSVRHIFCGGEELSVRLKDQALSQLSIALHHQYGPTEATIDAICWDCSPTDSSPKVPIGYPITNLAAYVLNDRLQQVEAGEVGELYLSGAGLARGYFRRPDITAERFLPHPFSALAGERLYRTGDLARYRSDGSLEFLGRRDHQVKVRGYRIELEEIEAVLDRYPGVQKSVVAVQKDAVWDNRLIAYVAPNQGSSLSIEELRSFLSTHLPTYMLPAALVKLDSLPLTPHGKIDRRSLPAPDWERQTEVATTYTAPRNQIERLLADIWTRVLGLHQIGMRDNFFELGADSIHCMRVAAAARKCGWHLTVTQIFEHQTIEHLASILSPLEHTQEANHHTAWDTPAHLSERFALARLNQQELEHILRSPLPVQDIYPLSPLQQGMLFHTLSEPDAALYFEQFICILQGNLDISAFEQAWQQTMDQYPGLRSAIVWQGLSEPHIVEYRQVHVPLIQYDWRGLRTDEQQEQLVTYEQADRLKGFVLSHPPLMRLTLIRLAQNRYYFLWSFHHLLIDGWSLSLLLKSVFRYYAATHRGQNIQVSEQRSYRDYITWLLQRDKKAAEAFWRGFLADFTTPTPLGIEQKHQERIAGVEKERYEQQQVLFSKTATAALSIWARQQQITMNTLTIGAWALLLSHYSREQDIVFGITVSGRVADLDGIEEMVGLFIHTLPIRIQVPPTASLGAWLRQVQATQAALHHYEYSSLSEVQSYSEVPPELPLFQSLLVFENYPFAEEQWKQPDNELLLERVYKPDRTNYPLTIVIFPGQQLRLAISYDRQRIDAGSIHRLLGHLQTILEAMTTSDTQHLADLPLLTRAERRQLLEEWNSARIDYPSMQGFHQLFEKQAQYTPDATAVVFGEEHLTYQALNARANQLAHYLRQRGVAPEVLVGICLHRSLDMVVSILATLKAGGAYVPLDLSYPQERLAFTLADARARLLLTQESLREQLSGHNIPLLCVDSEWQTIAFQSPADPVCEVTSAHAAYVIYTSGSTGRPKGVVIEHHNALTLLYWARDAFTAEERAGVLASTSICFDLSSFELFVPLSWGGMVILVENILQLESLPTSSLVTLINTVPSAITELLRLNSIPRTVRTINLAGEALQSHLVQEIVEQYPFVRVLNLYGPTEDTTYSTWAEVPGEEGNVPIGRPITNTDVYVLDQHLQPVPIGIPGEVFISGEGIARGYLHRPDTTAERFVPNPFSKTPGARLYKTGDLARYLPDGNLVFIKRIDHQVKLRGYRIELGEIETLLKQVPVVQEAVTLIREDTPGDQRLVAYVTLCQDKTTTVDELIAFLKQRLPGYMLPSALVLLDALPLTPNGKIDRRALPRPNPTHFPTRNAGYSAPRTPTETRLVRIWQDVLGVEEIGIHDDLFRIGGHSLLVTRLALHVCQAFNMRISLRKFFEATTIAEMARLIDPDHIEPATSLPILDLAAEASLDTSIFSETQASAPLTTETTGIFLTGATGFLGAFLLSELLQQTQADIYCLIRASTVEQGRERLQTTLETFGLWEHCPVTRIIPVPGDLAHPLLGLSRRRFHELACMVDCIYHSGALVNFLSPYAELKAANVLGTQEVLRFASHARLKAVHYLSTLSVFPPSRWAESQPLLEDTAIQHYQGFRTGYAQSKWVAEQLVLAARSHGLPIAIYRPGTITGDSQTGAWSTNDFLCRAMKGCILLGCIPDTSGTIEMIPVDYVSKAITYLSQQAASLGKIFHLINPQPIKGEELAGWLDALGYPLRRVPYAQWLEELTAAVETSTNSTLYTLLSVLSKDEDGHLLFHKENAHVEQKNTLQGLAGSNLQCPQITFEVFRAYLSYLLRSGYLEAPAQPVNADTR